MARTALTLFAAFGLSMWAAAQVPPRGPSAAEQARMLAANRTLLAALLADGLAVSDAGDDALARIDACRRAAATLSKALAAACDGNSPEADRVAELSDHLGEVLTQGLLPALDRARVNYREGSPDYPRFRELSAKSAADAKAAAAAIPDAGRLGDQPKVRTARAHLESAAKQFPE